MVSYISILHYSFADEWEEVYKSSYSGTVYNQNQRYERNSYRRDFYVYNVYFSNLGNEGVIYLKSDEIKSLISKCIFENSSNRKDGGSIFIDQGQSSIRKVCSFGSQSASNGFFCYIKKPDVLTNINEINDSSITFSNRGDQKGYGTVYLVRGNSLLQNNLTRNYGIYPAALYICCGENIL
ncbi:hypothetical protein TVAG_229100 [Trichomonas vaginalis G3]|uniref:Polymorphic repeat outer membrane protein n=1 Tax=Trichomonas vaginalis (strain ATCC PRA-98 / G3) TaxID=412133 RepID=A2FVC1_TRIV3|nr:hypothetical protein TVAGG3_0903840 [Trichomonas vaginalis G3]EAX91141.1 hypothetical protein TVAG_229100 [Trichomonas vaginalis G3]KAI5483897.1 hypothetical protein TVAGG3_0903840 [Trichomonas vaginalis G3]|eukprot:XP_001304071.1 hypothetical protein [Trichomonas vaginalis G3]